jgi:hypothetical protein
MNDELIFKKIQQFYDNGHAYHTLTFPNGMKIKGPLGHVQILRSIQNS